MGGDTSAAVPVVPVGAADLVPEPLRAAGAGGVGGPTSGAVMARMLPPAVGVAATDSEFTGARVAASESPAAVSPASAVSTLSAPVRGAPNAAASVANDAPPTVSDSVAPTSNADALDVVTVPVTGDAAGAVNASHGLAGVDVPVEVRPSRGRACCSLQ